MDEAGLCCNNQPLETARLLGRLCPAKGRLRCRELPPCRMAPCRCLGLAGYHALHGCLAGRRQKHSAGERKAVRRLGWPAFCGCPANSSSQRPPWPAPRTCGESEHVWLITQTIRLSLLPLATCGSAKRSAAALGLARHHRFTSRLASTSPWPPRLPPPPLLSPPPPSRSTIKSKTGLPVLPALSTSAISPYARPMSP